MMDALQSELDRARDDATVRVIVLAAHGKVFCAGHDLKEMTAHRADADRGRAFFQLAMTRCSALMQSIVGHPKPVIAEVDGLGNRRRLSACLQAATLPSHPTRPRSARRASTSGCSAPRPGVALARNVSRKQAMEMLLTGETIDAATAKDFGLVNRVVPREYLDQVVMKYAQTIASKSPLTLKIGKEAFYAQIEMGLARSL